MHLLDFEHFELVRELLRNRFTIVWCTRLQRAQADDERQRIEASPANQLPQPIIWLFCNCAWRQDIDHATLSPALSCSSRAYICLQLCKSSLIASDTYQGMTYDCSVDILQAEMAGSPDLAPILEMLNATRASARERQGEIERKIRAEARKLRQGDAAGVL